MAGCPKFFQSILTPEEGYGKFDPWTNSVQASLIWSRNHGHKHGYPEVLPVRVRHGSKSE